MSKFTVNQYAAAYQAAVKDKAGKEREVIAHNLVKTLAYRRQIKLLPRIMTALERLIAEAGGPIVVKIKATSKPDEQTCGILKQQLEKALGREVKVRCQVDPKILAGIKIQIGDQLIDNSLASRLFNLKKQLLTNS
ncbi:MAG: ATP synthase F1 subunit delta [Patescibacteria group bacterium]|jgi:F-type H+-transporting ATPase subunit delta